MKKRILISALAAISALMTQPSFALSVNVIDHENFSATQVQKLNQAVTTLNLVLNSPEFKTRVLSFDYQGTKGFVQNNGLTNEQLYTLLMNGAEQFPTPGPINLMADMHLSLYSPPWYRRGSSAVAFTSQSDEFLHIYNSYYNRATLGDLCETLIHEWTHKMGFDHDFQSTARRPYSVPYGIGGIINSLVTGK